MRMQLLVIVGLTLLAGLSAVITRAMTRLGVLDTPGARSSHDRPTPKGGGVAIATAFAIGTACAFLLPRPETAPQGTGTIWLLLGGLLIAALSWIDDLRALGFAAKLATQFAAGLLLVHGGFVLDHVGPLGLGVLAIPVTIVWFVGVTNAVNFIDGLNGLAAGSVLIVAMAASALTSGLGDWPMTAALLGLIAGIVGFLPYNFPRARIFMGDVGSQLCGLVIAAAATSLSHGAAGASLAHSTTASWGALVVPLGLSAILADVAFTLVRRLRAGDRLTEAHRGHLYQLANRCGVDAPLVTLIYWGLALWGSIIGLNAVDATPVEAISAVAIAVAPFCVWAVLVTRMADRASIGRW